ncbi:MAG: phosphomethylpyrimidine synthase, partial [Prosthecobacter sp.]|nr:phosphomethylpyrimidine synthase [Prosthecobacter sp.]
MIADPTSSFEAHSSEQLPASTRVYVQGQIHPEVQVPMREITLSPTKDFNGRIIENDPVRVYDTSGPWGDPDYNGTVEEGLPGLRKAWILARNDVEAYDGRAIEPRDNGYLTANHAEYAAAKREGLLSPLKAPINAQRQPLKALPGKVVTQLAYARAGIITPEMEFIAIRENMKRAKIADYTQDIVRSDLDKQHVGSSQVQSEYTPGIFKRFPQRIPNEI